MDTDGNPHLVLRTGHYTEGVVVDADGIVFFSMTGPGTISRFDPTCGAVDVWAHVPAANGHAIDPLGNHVVMSSVGAVVRLDANGRASNVIASQIGERWLTYPNDVVLDTHRGGMYFTDSGYKTTPQSPPQHPQGRVYRAETDGTLTAVADGFAYANGIALSADGSHLYVGESTTSQIWSYAVNADGSLAERALFATTPECPESSHAMVVPDGITLGPKASLYVAHYGAREILVYAPDGTLVRRLNAGNRTTSHVAFSPDGKTLYVSGGLEDQTGPGAIFAIDLQPYEWARA